jgi:hypothetical protein
MHVTAVISKPTSIAVHNYLVTGEAKMINKCSPFKCYHCMKLTSLNNDHQNTNYLPN